MKMRISREDYINAENCLKRYNYNCVKIMNIKSDIMSIGATALDAIPKAPYSISDTVYNQVVRLQEDKELQLALKEYKAVRQALELVNADCREIFENYYQKNKAKWEIMYETGLSERTFLRRKKDLIYTVEDELKKIS